MTFKEFIKQDKKFQEGFLSWLSEPSKEELKNREEQIKKFKENQLKDKDFAEKLVSEYDLNPTLTQYVAKYITNKRVKNLEENKELYQFLINDKIGIGKKFAEIDKEIKYYLVRQSS